MMVDYLVTISAFTRSQRFSKSGMDEWYQTYIKPNLRPGTQGGYEYSIYQQITPKIGDTPLGKFTPKSHDGKRELHCVYGKKYEECEQKLDEMIRGLSV